MQNALRTRMRIVFHAIRLELKTSVYEMTVTVVSTVPSCDVTTVQQHYTGSTSTPPRVARLCQIREASLVALRKIFKNLRMLTCVDRLTRPIHHIRIQRFVLTVEIIRRHCTIRQVNSSRSAQYPCQALFSICGISRVPALSFQCHSDSHRS